jgi:hypothetical protein
MKTKKLLSLLLLFALSFSIIHEFAIALYEDSHSHCDVVHYIKEFSEPVCDTDDQNNLCVSHYLFHISFILSNPVKLITGKQVSSVPKSNSFFYPTLIPQTFLKPPIV